MNKNTQYKIISNNKRAFFDYTILDKFEAGISLLGSEVKSLRQGKCSISESYIAKLNDSELELVNSHIASYSFANRFGHDERRNRKLLLHKSEIYKIISAISMKGCTAVPLKIYFNSKGLVKLEIAIANGKNTVDKRHSIKEKDWKREQSRTIKEYNIKT